MKRPAWMTDDLLETAQADVEAGVPIRDVADRLGLTYHKARELCRTAEETLGTNGWTTTVVISDVHVPFHDPAALSLALRFIRDTSPDRVVLNGDIVDFYKVSHFTRDPLRGSNLASEIAVGRRVVAAVRAAAPAAEIWYIEGNHEHRLYRYICSNAGELRGLDGLSVPEQLHLDRYDVNWVGCTSDQFIDTFVNLGPHLLVGHFDHAATYSGYTAKALLDKYGTSIIQGHVHSVGSSNKTLAHGIVMAWEGGCLCDLEPTYCVPRKWAHALTVVHQEPTGQFHVEPVLIIDGRLFYGGRLWMYRPADGDEWRV